MPRYDYKCDLCGDTKELFAQKEEETIMHPCACSRRVQISHKRIFSPAKAFILRGGGWYRDNYDKNKKEEAS